MKALTIGVLIASAGCANVVKGLSADEREGASRSLIFATIRAEAPLDDLALVRIAPREEWVHLRSRAPFQLLRAKHVHQDAFIAPNLPTGIYALAWFRAGGIVYAAEDKWLMRVEVTEPGVYDAGAWVSTGEMLIADPAPEQDRRAIALRDAVKGTKWAVDVEKLLPAVPAGSSKTAK